ncbi:Arylsulfatase [Anatilimnocola aggregata]|uniref:Arylsulfatase n=1 Tax=Anatilimnocola aggregata TaxID=2528021 RepID=A0A517YG14_9BACT|nr:sulfatase [Anatilimnocola aggregata]QDU29141.1 Arylsulfatase [Anatilimnocola aggregata]
MPKLLFRSIPCCTFLALIAAWVSAFTLLATGAEQSSSGRSPNVILIFIDDMGYADIGPFGNTEVKTPHLDKFAKEGMKFTSFYATPVCSMSRACLMTGCYNVRVSVPGVLFPNSTVGLHPDEVTLGDIAKQKGYATKAIGKWHLGFQPEFLPTKQGFDSYFGIPYSNDMGQKPARPNFPPLPLMRDDKIVETEPDQSQLTKRYTEEAVKLIREQKDNPFFLYLPHSMIHFPLFASADFKGKSKMGLIGDTIEEIDWSVGQIMQTLQELKLDDNTLVIFTSDNGPAARTAAPLRGNKGTSFEGGVREPCIMRWPGKIEAGSSCNQIAGNIDMLPTLAKIVGAQVPTDRVLDGRDITSLMFTKDAPAVRDTHLYFNGGSQLVGIRTGEWKLFLGGIPALGNKKKKGEALVGPSLYNLTKDLAETTNVAAENPEIVERLKTAAEKHLAEIKANQRPAGQAKASE